MTGKHRINGAVGALLDEYERAILHLSEVIKDIPDHDLILVVDNLTKDKECKSIQSILSHVVRAGYHYASYIRNHQGEALIQFENVLLAHAEPYVSSLWTMFKYTEQTFQDYPEMKIEENEPDRKMLVSWGQRYDVEQLMEHAIVHILRHRRQIERFLLAVSNSNISKY